MTSVNPYVNTNGWAVQVYSAAGTGWSVSPLLASASIALTPDGLVRNIWDPVGQRLLSWSNKYFRGTSAPAGNARARRAWVTPSSAAASDFERLNVLVVNNSALTLIDDQGRTMVTGQTTGIDLPLGRIRLQTSEGQLTEEFLIQPLPDQILSVQINLATTVTSTLDSSDELETVSINVSNCYNASLFVRQTGCRIELENERGNLQAQNLAQLEAGQQVRLQARSGFRLYLQSSDLRTRSGFFTVTTGGQVYFRADGTVSTTSCSGELFSTTTSASTTVTETEVNQAAQPTSFVERWWFVIVIIFLVLVVIIFAYVVYDQRRASEGEEGEGEVLEIVQPVTVG